MLENVFLLNVEQQLCFVFKTNHFYKRIEISECECFDEIIHNHSFDKHSIQMNRFSLNFLS